MKDLLQRIREKGRGSYRPSMGIAERVMWVFIAIDVVLIVRLGAIWLG